MSQEPSLWQLGRTFVVAVVFMKIPIIYFGVQVALEPEWWNILGLIASIIISISSLVYFVVKT